MRDIIKDIVLDTAGQPVRDAANRIKAQKALDTLNAKGNPLWKLITTPQSLLRACGSAILLTLSLYYVLPLLPGITFEGTIYGAAYTALVMMVLANAMSASFWFQTRKMLQRTVDGEKMTLLWAFWGLGLVLFIPAEFVFITFYPGYLSLSGLGHGFWYGLWHGFWALTFACATQTALGFCYSKVVGYFFPTPAEEVPQIEV